MGFSAQGGHIILRTQTTPGTYNSDTGTAGVGVKIRSGSLAPQRDLLITDPEIGGGRDVTDAYLGPIHWTGSYDFYVRMNELTTILQSMCGATVTPTVATGVTTCTFTPSDGAGVKLLSIEEAIGSSLECFNYNDAVVNSLHLEAAADGYLMGTVDIIAKGQLAGATASDPTAVNDNTNLVVGTNITVTYNAVTLTASDFKFDFTNNFDDTFYKLGSLFLADLTPKRREITASFTIREQDSSLWRQANLGTSSSTTAGGISTKQQLIITCSTYEFIPTSSTPFGLTITIPKFILKPYDFAPNGDDVIDNEVEGEAVRPAIGTPIVTFVTKSSNATIA